MSPRKKFAFSIAAFVLLALLSWNTMSSVPIPVHSTQLGIDFNVDFRMITLAILGLLATRTALSFLRASSEEKREARSKHE